MQLHVAEFLLGGKIARARDHFKVAILDLPFSRGPLRKVRAVEQNDGVRCRAAWLCRRRNHTRMGTRRIVDMEWKPWQHWGVGVSEIPRILGQQKCGAENEDRSHARSISWGSQSCWLPTGKGQPH